MKFLLNAVLCAILFTCTAEYQVVKIGAIFFNDENDLMDAFDTAIHDINLRELDVRLEAVKHFLSLDDSIALQQLTCDLIENGVAAIFGPSSKARSDIVEVLCNLTGIPHLQYDWHGQETQLQRRRNHQMTVNVAPTELMLSTAYWDILRSKDFDWHSFTIAYESDTDLTRMQHLFAWKQLHKSGIKLRPFSRGDDYRIMWKQISSAREKYVLLDCPADIVTDVVNASIFYNMTSMFNYLFLTNLDTHLSTLDSLYSSEFAVSTSAVRLRAYVPPPTHDEKDVFEEDDEEKIVSLRTQLIYDSVVLFFTAVRNVIHLLRFYEPQLSCQRGFWKSGPQVLQQMKMLTPRNVTTPYKTQKLQLNEFGEREDFNLEIYNPMIDRISHVWHKEHQLISFDKVSENSTKMTKKRRLEGKEDFSQKRVRYTVATRVGEPYFMWRPEPEGVHYEGNERFVGYAVDLIYKLAEECRFDFAFEPVNDNNYGNYDPVSDDWNGIIREVIDNNAQIGICDLTITQARRSVVDFTVPFMQLGVSILYYKTPPPPKNLFAFLKPYALEVWVYLLIAMIVMALVLVMTARISQPEWTEAGPNEEKLMVVENQWNLINTIWLIIASISYGGSDILPRGPPMRFFTAFWWIFALLLSQTYIAKLASFITSSKMEGSIGNLHDLVDQNKVQFGTIKGASTSHFFSESNESDFRVAWNKMIAMKPDAFTSSNQEGVDRVKRSRGRYAFLMETTSLQYHVERNCELTQIGEPFGEKHYGIAVPLNAPFRSNLSVGILKLSEKGVLYSLKNKWFNSNDTTQCDDANAQKEDTQFDMDSVGGLFIVLIGGVLVGVVIGIFEFFWNVHKISLREKIAPTIVLKAELRFLLYFWLRRKPLRPYLRSRGSTLTGTGTGGNSTTEPSTASTTPELKKNKKKRSKQKQAKTS